MLSKCVHSNGLKLSGSLEEFFYHLTIFGFKNAKTNFLKKSIVLKAVFIELKFQVITNPSSRLEKRQSLGFLLLTEFL